MHRTIRLENGLTALLISDPSRVLSNDDTSSEEEESEQSSGLESESGHSAHSGSDHHGHTRRAEFDEEKLVSFNSLTNFFQYFSHSYYISVLV